MDIAKVLNGKTALEHLIFLSDINSIGVCRELQITPQQFTDWIKKRRPIPMNRLLQLTEYFNVTPDLLVDGKRFVRHLSALTRIEIEILVVSNKTKEFCTKGEAQELDYRLEQLEKEKQKQIRITRLSAILEMNNPILMQRIDAVLDELEENNS